MDHFGSINFLDGSHLEAAELVDAVDHTILGDLVELRNCLRDHILQHASLESLIDIQLHKAELGWRGVGDPPFRLNLEPRGPRSRELWPGVGHHKVLVREANSSPVSDAPLLAHQTSDLQDVLEIWVRRREGIAFLRAVALRHVEDVQQQLLVISLHARPRLLAQIVQEGLAKRSACFQRRCITTAGRQAALEALLGGKGELVQVEIHTLRHLALTQLEALRHEHRAS
mmetsp:Transcript_46637/g.83617  ORF Transcript_46637/g.83617 Transcript_46637/m.83617 type:complete len:228 (+) Transcript_46637:729-1412(+)